MLNLLFVYSSGRHQAAQRGFAGSSAGEVWGHGKISALIFPVLSLGSAGNMDPEVSFTLPEVGAEIYPLTSDRAKFKTLQGLKNSVGKKRRVWKRMRKKLKKRQTRRKQLQGFDMAKMEKMWLIWGQQSRTKPGWEPKDLCPCSQLGDVLLPLARSLH